MFNSEKFTPYLQSSLWAEAANTAMLFEKNLITPNRTLSSFQQFFGKRKKSSLSLMQKVGEKCMHILIFNPKTKKIILTQDMTFLQKSYSEYTKIEKPVVLTTSYEGLDDEE